MVAKLRPPSLGSRESVLSLVVHLTKVNTAMTTPCKDVLIMSLLKVWSLAVMLPPTLLFVVQLAPATHQSTMRKTKLKVLQPTALRVSRPSSRRSTLTEPSLLPSPSTKTSSHTPQVFTSTWLEPPRAVTLLSASAGELKTDKTTGSALTPGTTPGVTKAPSKFWWATAASTIRCTLVWLCDNQIY